MAEYGPGMWSRKLHQARQMSASAGRVCDGGESGRPWILAVVDGSPGDDGGFPPAVPAVYRGTAGRPGPVLFTLDVDGERSPFAGLETAVPPTTG